MTCFLQKVLHVPEYFFLQNFINNQRLANVKAHFTKEVTESHKAKDTEPNKNRSIRPRPVSYALQHSVAFILPQMTAIPTKPDASADKPGKQTPSHSTTPEDRTQKLHLGLLCTLQEHR